MPRREISLSTFGLETVQSACARKKWAAKTVQNWVNAGLLPAVVVGGGRGGGMILLRVADVDAFERPKPGPKPGPKPKTPAKSRRK